MGLNEHVCGLGQTAFTEYMYINKYVSMCVRMWAHTCRPAQMSHLDRQTSDWFLTKEGREKTKKESGVRESSEVVLLLFYKATTTSNNMGKKILAARREVKHTTYSSTLPLFKEKTWTVYSSVCAFWRITTVPITTTTTKRIKKTLKTEWSSVRINLLKEEEIKSLKVFFKYYVVVNHDFFLLSKR